MKVRVRVRLTLNLTLDRYEPHDLVSALGRTRLPRLWGHSRLRRASRPTLPLAWIFVRGHRCRPARHGLLRKKLEPGDVLEKAFVCGCKEYISYIESYSLFCGFLCEGTDADPLGMVCFGRNSSQVMYYRRLLFVVVKHIYRSLNHILYFAASCVRSPMPTR